MSLHQRHAADKCHDNGCHACAAIAISEEVAKLFEGELSATVPTSVIAAGLLDAAILFAKSHRDDPEARQAFVMLADGLWDQNQVDNASTKA